VKHDAFSEHSQEEFGLDVERFGGWLRGRDIPPASCRQTDQRDGPHPRQNEPPRSVKLYRGRGLLFPTHSALLLVKLHAVNCMLLPLTVATGVDLKRGSPQVLVGPKWEEGMSRNLLISGWRSSPDLRDDGRLFNGVVDLLVTVA
jgi:hypothetical protein